MANRILGRCDAACNANGATQKIIILRMIDFIVLILLNPFLHIRPMLSFIKETRATTNAIVIANLSASFIGNSKLLLDHFGVGLSHVGGL